jgi:hypothetical protein
MVEPRMERDKRRIDPHSGTRERIPGGLPGPDAGADTDASSGWDPYEVWREQVKQARDLAAVRDASESQERIKRNAAPPPAPVTEPRWRVRLAALLPRHSG